MNVSQPYKWYYQLETKYSNTWAHVGHSTTLCLCPLITQNAFIPTFKALQSFTIPVLQKSPVHPETQSSLIIMNAYKIKLPIYNHAMIIPLHDRGIGAEKGHTRTKQD